jgi:pSer/pThr/pTyr-binding forkhead associated (FHA) protein
MESMESLVPEAAPPGEVTQIVDDPDAYLEGACTAQLTLLAGPQLGRVIPLTRATLTLGRAREADVRLSHTSVSKRHALVRRLVDGGFEIEDLGSSNGTRVGGQPVRGRRRLRTGDRIQLGPRILLQFTLIDQLDRRVREL